MHLIIYYLSKFPIHLLEFIILNINYTFLILKYFKLDDLLDNNLLI